MKTVKAGKVRRTCKFYFINSHFLHRTGGGGEEGRERAEKRRGRRRRQERRGRKVFNQQGHPLATLYKNYLTV